jgi:hypothetical protein
VTNMPLGRSERCDGECSTGSSWVMIAMAVGSGRKVIVAVIVLKREGR